MSVPSYLNPLNSELIIWLQILGKNRNVSNYELPIDMIINTAHFISLVPYPELLLFINLKSHVLLMRSLTKSVEKFSWCETAIKNLPLFFCLFQLRLPTSHVLS